MEKQRVNDAIVKLGNLIHKARVHVAHRLSSKIRQLRGKKDEKSGKRIERLISEIAFLKTLSRSGTRKAAARKMLLNTEDVTKIIERESTSPEERAFCRLCKTKFIEKFISNFREENVDWKYWVPPLLAMWEKKVEMKTTRILKPESSEPKRMSAREIAEARKRKEVGDTEDHENHVKRSKRDGVLPDRQTASTKKKKSAADRFKIEPIRKSGDAVVASAAESDDLGKVESTKKTRGSRQTAEEDSGSGDELSLESIERSESISASRNREESPADEDARITRSSSSPDVPEVLFGPYAPKYPVGGEESGDSGSGSDVDSNNDHDQSEEDESGDDSGGRAEVEGSEDDHEEEESGDEPEGEEGDSESERSFEVENEDESVEEGTPLRNKPGSSAMSVKELEKVFDEDSSEEEDDDHDDEDSSDEDESDRERKFEERIEKRFKSNGSQKRAKIPVSSYEPDSSEEEFPAPEERKNVSRDGKQEDGDEDEARESSFFLRKGQQPEDVKSRTIPKERAPGLNRRQRRGHEKQRVFNEAGSDGDEEVEPRSSMTFGRDFRPQKSFQRHERPQAFGGKKSFGRSSAGPRGPPNGRPNRDGRFQSGKNPRVSLPGNLDRFPTQESRRKSITAARETIFEQRTNRNGGPSNPHSRGRFDQKNQRSPGPPRPPSQQRSGSNSAACQTIRTQDTPRPGTGDKLHPSWLAKKILSASLNQPFQGKKTVFED